MDLENIQFLVWIPIVTIVLTPMALALLRYWWLKD